MAPGELQELKVKGLQSDLVLLEIFMFMSFQNILYKVFVFQCMWFFCFFGAMFVVLCFILFGYFQIFSVVLPVGIFFHRPYDGMFFFFFNVGASGRQILAKIGCTYQVG